MITVSTLLRSSLSSQTRIIKKQQGMKLGFCIHCKTQSIIMDIYLVNIVVILTLIHQNNIQVTNIS
ncbi:Uncharacterised protein [Mycobacteroides abscessus subsp. abscessus]|nr:Uncharacterised protein [Mycobacteroides abscessus subsp. abscessus]